MARTLANILKRHYRVLFRTPATFSQPADAATFSTIEPSEQEALDTGKKKFMGWNGHLEGILLQSEVADYTAVEAIENTEQDILFYSEVTGMCIFFPNAILVFKEAISSGETETIPFEYDAEDLSTKSAFRTRFAEPTT